MVDNRILARNWAGWFGITGAAEAMGVTEEQIREWIASPAAASLAASSALPQRVNDVPMAADTEKRTRNRYTPEQKAEALRLLSEIGATKASRQTGISIASLMKWRQENLQH